MSCVEALVWERELSLWGEGVENDALEWFQLHKMTIDDRRNLYGEHRKALIHQSEPPTLLSGTAIRGSQTSTTSLN